MPNYRYYCPLCDFDSTQAYYVNHLVSHHLDTPIKDSEGNLRRHGCFEMWRVAGVIRSSKESKTTRPLATHCCKFESRDAKKFYELYCCLGCNKFWNNLGKAECHFEKNTECSKKHIERVIEVHKTMTDGEAQRKKEKEGTDAPKNIIISGGASETEINAIHKQYEEQLSKLKEENTKLAREKKILGSKLAMAEEEVKRLADAEAAADKLDELKFENETLQYARYKYERLRYVLLLGLVKDRDWNGNEVARPILSMEHRRKLINALEGNNMLPCHADGENDWYDEWFFNDATVPEYEFPIDYPKEKTDDDDE